MQSKESAQRAWAGRDGAVDLDRDRALVRRCQNGDGPAFAELYTQYHDRLHRFCFRRLLDRDEADEITQETFLRAWKALPAFGGGMRFYPWLTVIAKNLCTDVLRRRARCAVVENLDRSRATDVTRIDPGAAAMSSEEAVMAAYDGSLAVEAMTRLSERYRNVLRLREEAGLSYQQIANREGVEVSTVETLLWRARQALKREYSALADSPVLAGLLVSLRRLPGRFARPGNRAIELAERLRPGDVVAACALTATLAAVSALPALFSSPAAHPPVGPVPALSRTAAPRTAAIHNVAPGTPVGYARSGAGPEPSQPPAAGDGASPQHPTVSPGRAPSVTVWPGSTPSVTVSPGASRSATIPTPPAPTPPGSASSPSGTGDALGLVPQLPAVVSQLPAAVSGVSALAEQVAPTVVNVVQSVVAGVAGTAPVTTVTGVLSALGLG